MRERVRLNAREYCTRGRFRVGVGRQLLNHNQMQDVKLHSKVLDGRQCSVKVNAKGYFDATAMCASEGKMWAQYWRNQGTQTFLTELASRVGLDTEQLVIKGKEGNGGRHVWAHPGVRPHLLNWTAQKFSTKLGTGEMVYAVTSPLLGAVKIGRWSGSETTLLNRYRVYYGADVQLQSAVVDDSRDIESCLLCLFHPFHLNGELFDKVCWISVTTILDRLRT